MSTQPQGTATVPATQLEKTIADSVLNKVSQFEKSGVINLPPGYSAANALKFAWLILQTTVDRDKNPVLSVCSKDSIANSLLEMVIQGLNPMKKQCYFIARGKRLTMARSYMGAIAVARRYAKVKDIIGQVIYEKDVFVYEIDTATGRKKLVEHKQEIENIDLTKIRGGYAITMFEDGSSSLEVMTFEQIQKAWLQGDSYKTETGSKVTNNFTDEMVMKTVIARAAKRAINSSDDTVLFKEEDPDSPMVYDTQAEVLTEIKENANLEELALEDAKQEEIIIPQQEQKEAVVVHAENNLFGNEEKQTGPNF